MRKYLVTLLAESEDSGHTYVHWDGVLNGRNKKEVREKVMQEWDPRLYSASCKPVFLITHLKKDLV